MLVDLPTLITRSVRRKRPLAYIKVSSLAMGMVVSSYAEEEKMPVVLVYAMGVGPTTDRVVIKALKEVLEASSQESAIIVPLDPDFVGGALTEHAQGVIIDERHAWPALSLPIVGDLMALPSEAELMNLRERVVSVLMPSGVQSAHVKEAAKSHLPLVVRGDNLSAASLQGLVKVGAHGLYLEDELQFAYTAGLRTVLRDRERWDPIEYEVLALHAVRNTLRNRLHTFYHH